MIHLKGRRMEKTVEAVIGLTLLEHALKNDVEWGFSCTRGTCARCRTRIESGMEYLSEPNEAELLRLDPEEIEQGYRLGCQAKVVARGTVKAVHETYF